MLGSTCVVVTLLHNTRVQSINNSWESRMETTLCQSITTKKQVSFNEVMMTCSMVGETLAAVSESSCSWHSHCQQTAGPSEIYLCDLTPSWMVPCMWPLCVHTTTAWSRGQMQWYKATSIQFDLLGMASLLGDVDGRTQNMQVIVQWDCFGTKIVK